jgi:hypothetical protein
MFSLNLSRDRLSRLLSENVTGVVTQFTTEWDTTSRCALNRSVFSSFSWVKFCFKGLLQLLWRWSFNQKFSKVAVHYFVITNDKKEQSYFLLFVRVNRTLVLSNTPRPVAAAWYSTPRPSRPSWPAAPAHLRKPRTTCSWGSASPGDASLSCTLADYTRYVFKKVPPYTLAGFDLTAYMLSSGDNATRPRRHRAVF